MLRSLHHLKNEKAKTYVAGFFNGDLKVFDGKDSSSKELLCVSKFHEDKITDALYFKCDGMGGKKILVTSSEQPFSEFKVSELSTQNNQVTVLASASEDLAERLGGWTSLSLNPATDNLIASACKNFVRNPSDAEGESYGSI